MKYNVTSAFLPLCRSIYRHNASGFINGLLLSLFMGQVKDENKYLLNGNCWIYRNQMYTKSKWPESESITISKFSLCLPLEVFYASPQCNCLYLWNVVLRVSLNTSWIVSSCCHFAWNRGKRDTYDLRFWLLEKKYSSKKGWGKKESFLL